MPELQRGLCLRENPAFFCVPHPQITVTNPGFSARVAKDVGFARSCEKKLLG
jgi:hypothetical protein